MTDKKLRSIIYNIERILKSAGIRKFTHDTRDFGNCDGMSFMVSVKRSEIKENVLSELRKTMPIIKIEYNRIDGSYIQSNYTVLYF